MMRDSELRTKYPILRRSRRRTPVAPEVVVVDERPHFVIRMGWLCRLVVAAFALIYAGTLLWNGIGLLVQGGEPVPLAGVTLVVIGLPWTPAAFRMAGFSYWPFGRQVIDRDTGATSLLLNIVWLVFAGWWLAVHHIVLAVAQAVTIIGIPFALQHLKLATVSLTPVGKMVVEA